MQDAPTWLAYVTALGAIATPIIVIALGAWGWLIRSRFERRVELENQLREDRIQIYNDILEPFVIAFTADLAWKSDPKRKNKSKEEALTDILLSLDYRRKAFKMVLLGSDGVVRAYDNLMQHFYNQTGPGANPLPMLSLLGDFLLEVRRSMGNEATKLTNVHMLEWFITDLRETGLKPSGSSR